MSVFFWLAALRRPSVFLALSAAGQASLPMVHYEACLESQPSILAALGALNVA